MSKIALSPLTEKEYRLAERYGYIIEEVLAESKLSPEDYYDDLAFAFLRAVKNYFAQQELHNFGFEKIARGTLKSAIRKNKPQTVSLAGTIRNMENQVVILYSKNQVDPEQEMIKKQLLEAVYGLITEDEKDILLMHTSGSPDAEIARCFHLDPACIREKIKNIKQYVIKHLPKSLVEDLGYERR